MGPLFQRNVQVEAAFLPAEALLCDPRSGKFFVLNRTTSFIWNQLERAVVAEEVAVAICQSFQDVSHAEVLRDVRTVLQDMVALELITSVISPDTQPAEMMGEQSAFQANPGMPTYETPTIMSMDENEVLSNFQITAFGTTWWSM